MPSYTGTPVAEMFTLLDCNAAPHSLKIAQAETEIRHFAATTGVSLAEAKAAWALFAAGNAASAADVRAKLLSIGLSMDEVKKATAGVAAEVAATNPVLVQQARVRASLEREIAAETKVRAAQEIAANKQRIEWNSWWAGERTANEKAYTAFWGASLAERDVLEHKADAAKAVRRANRVAADKRAVLTRMEDEAALDLLKIEIDTREAIRVRALAALRVQADAQALARQVEMAAQQQGMLAQRIRLEEESAAETIRLAKVRAAAIKAELEAELVSQKEYSNLVKQMRVNEASAARASALGLAPGAVAAAGVMGATGVAPSGLLDQFGRPIQPSTGGGGFGNVRFRAGAGGIMPYGYPTGADIAAFAAGFGVYQAIKQAALFNDAMNKSLSIMGKMSDFMKNEMRQSALDLAAQYGISAIDIEKGFYHLQSAGYDAQKSLESLPTVVQFAFTASSKGVMEIGRATELLTTVSNALGATAPPLARIADLLILADSLAAGTGEQFAESLAGKGAGAVRILGKDLEEALAMLATLAKLGIRAKDGQQALVQIFRDLVRQQERHKEVFIELNGVQTTYYDLLYKSNGEVRNMADIFRFLEKALQGATVEQKIHALAVLGLQQRTTQASQAFLGFSGSMAELESKLRTTQGKMAEVASIRLEGAVTQFKQLREVVRALGIDLGELVLPPLLGISKAIRDAVSAWRDLPLDFRVFLTFRPGLGPSATVAQMALNSIYPSIKPLSGVKPLYAPRGVDIGTGLTGEPGYFRDAEKDRKQREKEQREWEKRQNELNKIYEIQQKSLAEHDAWMISEDRAASQARAKISDEAALHEVSTMLDLAEDERRAAVRHIAVLRLEPATAKDPVKQVELDAQLLKIEERYQSAVVLLYKNREDLIDRIDRARLDTHTANLDTQIKDEDKYNKRISDDAAKLFDQWVTDWAKAEALKEENSIKHERRQTDMQRRTLDFEEKTGKISAATKLWWYNYLDSIEEERQHRAIQNELDLLEIRGISDKRYLEDHARLTGEMERLNDEAALRLQNAYQQSASLAISAWRKVEMDIGRGLERSFSTFISGLADLVFPRPSSQTDPLAPIVQAFREAYNQLSSYSNPKRALEDVIQSIIDAGTEAKANAIAVKYFGATAGPQLARELRTGKISVDDITAAIKEATKSTIEYEQRTNSSTKNISTLWKQLGYDIALAILKTIIEYGLAVFLKWIFHIQDASVKLADVLAAVWKKIANAIRGGTDALREFAREQANINAQIDAMLQKMATLPQYSGAGGGGGGEIFQPQFSRWGGGLPWYTGPDDEEPYDEEPENYVRGRSVMAALRPGRGSSEGGVPQVAGSTRYDSGGNFYIANLNVTANNADELVRQLKSLKVVKGLT